jgi:hypothetical protein
VLHYIIEHNRIDHAILFQALRKVFIDGQIEVLPRESPGFSRDLNSERAALCGPYREKKAAEPAPHIHNTLLPQTAHGGG